MTVKTTTKAPGDPVKGGVKKLTPVTVTGDKNNVSAEQWKAMTKEQQYSNEMAKRKGAGWSEYTAGIGSKAGGQKLSQSELDAFNKRQSEIMGHKILAKEVRYAKGDEGAKSGNPKSGYQVDYADPSKDKDIYERDKRARNAQMLKDMPPLKTKKLSTIPGPTPELIRPTKKKTKEMVPKAIEGPKGQGRQFKSAPKAGKFTSGNRILKSAGTPGGGAEGRKFRREEKLAGAYERNKALRTNNLLLDRNSEDRTYNMGLGAKSKAKSAAYKDMRNEIKGLKKESKKLTVRPETKKAYQSELKTALKDTRKSLKFEKKEAAGKIKYFTKSKMAEQVEKKPTSKGKMQAGKMRYN